MIKTEAKSQSLIDERKLFINGCLLLFTPDCPAKLKSQINLLVETSGSEWLRPINSEANDNRMSYEVVNAGLMHDKVFILKKHQRTQPLDENLKIGYFSQSLVHEMRTSKLLRHFLEQEATRLPQTIEHDNKTYQLRFTTPRALGALVDSKKHARFIFFEKAFGVSIKSLVTEVGGWNELNQEERSLFAQFHQVLNSLSPLCDQYDFEPWDLGVHQLLYTINDQTKEINLVIVDTEEYNIPSRFGQQWDKGFNTLGLPPIILFL